MKERTDGNGAPHVIECIGSQWPLDIANDFIGERGRLAIAGYHQDGPRPIDMQPWNWLGLAIDSERGKAVFCQKPIDRIGEAAR